jgi:predicted O-methyltransferase YrrM
MTSKIEYFHKTIPGWASFGKLYVEAVRLAPKDRPSHFVEIGSWMGRSAALMATEIHNSGKPITFDCIDPWTDGGPDLKHKAHMLTEPLFDTFMRNIAPVAPHIRPKQMPSLEAVHGYSDGQLDFIMIDGSHQYEDVKADIAAWWPKMKSGAIFAGDDYNWGGVVKAVKEFFPKEVLVNVHELPKKPHLKKAPAYWWVRVP